MDARECRVADKRANGSMTGGSGNVGGASGSGSGGCAHNIDAATAAAAVATATTTTTSTASASATITTTTPSTTSFASPAPVALRRHFFAGREVSVRWSDDTWYGAKLVIMDGASGDGASDDGATWRVLYHTGETEHRVPERFLRCGIKKLRARAHIAPLISSFHHMAGMVMLPPALYGSVDEDGGNRGATGTPTTPGGARKRPRSEMGAGVGSGSCSGSGSGSGSGLGPLNGRAKTVIHVNDDGSGKVTHWASTNLSPKAKVKAVAKAAKRARFLAAPIHSDNREQRTAVLTSDIDPVSNALIVANTSTPGFDAGLDPALSSPPPPPPPLLPPPPLHSSLPSHQPTAMPLVLLPPTPPSLPVTYRFGAGLSARTTDFFAFMKSREVGWEIWHHLNSSPPH